MFIKIILPTFDPPCPFACRNISFSKIVLSKYLNHAHFVISIQCYKKYSRDNTFTLFASKIVFQCQNFAYQYFWNIVIIAKILLFNRYCFNCCLEWNQACLIKRWVIVKNLLFKIYCLNQWNFVTYKWRKWKLGSIEI